MNSSVPDRANASDPDYPLETGATIACYDETAAEFATRWGTLRLERALATFTQHLTGQRQVLDLGCGPGRDIGFLTQLGCKVVGLDLSMGMLSEARKCVPSAFLVHADLCLPPFASGRFDGIWACASLLHLPRAGFLPALVEVARLLGQSGGVLYLAMKAGQGERWVTGHSGRRTFFTYYQPSEIETALGRAGFQPSERWAAEDQAGRDQAWINVIAKL